MPFPASAAVFLISRIRHFLPIVRLNERDQTKSHKPVMTQRAHGFSCANMGRRIGARLAGFSGERGIWPSGRRGPGSPRRCPNRSSRLGYPAGDLPRRCPATCAPGPQGSRAARRNLATTGLLAQSEFPANRVVWAGSAHPPCGCRIASQGSHSMSCAKRPKPALLPTRFSFRSL